MVLTAAAGQEKEKLANYIHKRSQHTKIADSHTAGRREQDVLRLEVPMDNSAVVQVIHSAWMGAHKITEVGWFTRSHSSSSAAVPARGGATVVTAAAGAAEAATTQATVIATAVAQ
jgi:hypothetical protein